jgi:NAD(P)H-hydrate repair Nnr-like enzyme with NAD(P)H-hydrate dehydratase domain
MATPTPQFIRQTNEPLHPQVLFSRPITRMSAGRLLLPGGHSGEFSLPTAINQLALAAGLGECRVVFPDVLAKLLGGAPAVAFAPSTESGSLAREALGRILELSEETDAVGLGASLSGNSSTSMLVERLATDVKKPLIVFAEALPALRPNLSSITNRTDVLIIATMPEVFKLCGNLHIPINVRPGGGLVNKLEIIQNLAAASSASYAVYGTEVIIASSSETPTVTPIEYELSSLPALFYAVLSTYWMQNLSAPLAGLTTGAYIIREIGHKRPTNQAITTSTIAGILSHITHQDDF